MPGDTMGHPGRWPCWSTSGECFAGVPAKPRVLQRTLSLLPTPPKALLAAVLTFSGAEFLCPTSTENTSLMLSWSSQVLCAS